MSLDKIRSLARAVSIVGALSAGSADGLSQHAEQVPTQDGLNEISEAEIAKLDLEIKLAFSKISPTLEKLQEQMDGLSAVIDSGSSEIETIKSSIEKLKKDLYVAAIEHGASVKTFKSKTNRWPEGMLPEFLAFEKRLEVHESGRTVGEVILIKKTLLEKYIQSRVQSMRLNRKEEVLRTPGIQGLMCGIHPELCGLDQ